ncbi:MAG: hypothetical protein J6L88_06155, partial [Clostridia bacterium]|nr:hypothetical protein [Clostridia bacterium]
AETVLHQQHLDMLSGTQQLAVLQIAQQRGCNADAAISAFEALQSTNKKADPLRYVDLDDRDNRQMMLYYVLRYVLDIPYHAMPKVNFASGSDFAKAHLMYRRGQNYKKAEDELKRILDSQSASKEEKAWAAWVISCICRREHQVPQPMSTDPKIIKAYETKSKTERRRADEMEKRAMAGGCPMVLHDEASLGMLLWSENINALGMMAALFEQKNPQLSAFFADYAKREESLQSDLGNPMNKEKWGRYETGCIVPAYLQLCKEELRIRREGINQRKKAVSDRYWHRTMADERQKVVKDVKKFKGKGFYPFDELMEHMETEIADDISWVDYYDKVEEEQRQARQRAIEREMEAFEEERDDRERMINAVFGQGYFTEQENYLLGRISGSEMIGSALSRDEARDRHRQMVEAAYDESHKNI